MSFRDMFEQKLQSHQEGSAAGRQQAEKAASDHAAVVAELEPKLKSLVLEVFDALQSAGYLPVEVSRNGATTGVLAYGLGAVQTNRWGNNPEVEVAIDSEGRMALRHAVTADRERPHTVRGCTPLDEGYAELLKLACRDDEPYGEKRVHLNVAGDLTFTDRYIASDDWQHKRMPLAEYLAELAAKAVAGA
jgi:hypothetical protein